jgi:hypothetical protein
MRVPAVRDATEYVYGLFIAMQPRQQIFHAKAGK